ncbi:hypothetical protein VPZ60_004327 [Salmonella enterica]|nr:hypothetical protein [Salmonella enterica]
MKKLIIAAALMATATSAMAGTTFKLCKTDSQKGAIVVLDKEDNGTRQFWAFLASDLNNGKLAPLYKSMPMNVSNNHYSSQREYTGDGANLNSVEGDRYTVEEGYDTHYLEGCMDAPSRYRVIIAARGKADPKAIEEADQQDALEKQAKAEAKAAENSVGLDDAVAAAAEEKKPDEVASNGLKPGTHHYTCDIEHWRFGDENTEKLKTVAGGAHLKTVAMGTFGRIEVTYVAQGETKPAVVHFAHYTRAEYGEPDFALMKGGFELTLGRSSNFYELTNCKAAQ